MKILMQEKTMNKNKLTIPLNIKALDFSKADICDHYITVPYHDPTLLQDENINQLVTSITEQTNFVFPDYDKTKFNLVFTVNEDYKFRRKLEVFKAHIEIIVQPPFYTKEKRESILKHETDEEMYKTWQEIFFFAEDYYRNPDKYFDKCSEEYEVEINKIKEVEQALFDILF